MPGVNSQMQFMQRLSIGTPASIGTAQNSSLGAVSTFTMTTTANIVAGDLAIVGVYVGSNNSVTVASVSDGTNSYTKADSTGIFSFSELTIWYKANASAVSSGATVTATFSVATTGAGNVCEILAARVPLVTSSAVDKFAHNSRTDGVANITTTTAALSQPNEIAFGFAAARNAGALTYSGASGFTAINTATDGANDRSALDYAINSTGAAVSFAPAFSAASVRLGAVVATFRGY